MAKPDGRSARARTSHCHQALAGSRVDAASSPAAAPGAGSTEVIAGTSSFDELADGAADGKYSFGYLTRPTQDRTPRRPRPGGVWVKGLVVWRQRIPAARAAMR